MVKKVQEGKDQEKAQSEKHSHSKNRGGKKVSLHDAGILSRSHIQEGWQYQSLVDFQLVSSLIPFRSQIFAQSLPNATLAFAILAVTSSSTCTSLQNL